MSNDNVRVSGLRAISEHNPPQVNDRIKIQFRLGLREGAVEPVVLGYTFTGARNPANANKDFGEGNYEKILTPHESLDIESSILVTEEGVWSFWPCYAIGNTFCPDEWRAFQVAVVKMPVAVGTALTGGPPHRSQRAELPHWAPASGSGSEAHFREGML
ncbi:MAG: hypothetical protein LC776_14865, partial [Acidobacteria bacterium]|nr:hypothetical protein [Acidobacteriota bacterium]